MNRSNSEGVSQHDNPRTKSRGWIDSILSARRLERLIECNNHLVICEDELGGEMEHDYAILTSLEHAGLIERVTRPPGAITGRVGPVDIFRPTPRGNAIIGMAADMLTDDMLTDDMLARWAE